jgi:hypothetical protein
VVAVSLPNPTKARRKTPPPGFEGKPVPVPRTQTLVEEKVLPLPLPLPIPILAPDLADLEPGQVVHVPEPGFEQIRAKDNEPVLEQIRSKDNEQMEKDMESPLSWIPWMIILALLLHIVRQY